MGAGVRGAKEGRRMITLRKRTYTSGRQGWQADIHAIPAGERARQRYRLQVPPQVTSRSGAQRWAEDRRREIETQGPPVTTKAGRQQAAAEVAAVEAETTRRNDAALTVAEVLPLWIGECEAARLSPGTISSRRRCITDYVIPVLGARRLADFSDRDAADLRRALADLGPGSANTVIAMTRAMVRTMSPILGVRPPVERWGRVKDDRPQEARAYDPATIERIIAAAGELSPEHLVVVLLAAEGALRCGEILGVQVGDVEGDRLHVRRQIIADGNVLHVRAPKANRVRTVPLSARAAAAVAALAEGRSAGAWLVERDGGHATPSVVRCDVGAAMARAGVPKVGAHALRHTGLSHMLAAGTDLRAVQAIAGHSSVNTTARYLHAMPDAVRTAGDRLAGYRREAAETVTHVALVPQPRRRSRKK